MCTTNRSGVEEQIFGVENRAADTICETNKRATTLKLLSVNPYFDMSFEIHIDGSKHQLGALVAQHSKPTAVFSRKLKDAQISCTLKEHGLLATVKTLEELLNAARTTDRCPHRSQKFNMQSAQCRT
jgi:hypothetical protein